MKSFKEMQELARAVDKAFETGHVWADCVSPHYELPVIEAEISGDWKHDHLRAKWIVKEQFPEFTYIGEQVTEEDGSDWYSAIHRWVVA